MNTTKFFGTPGKALILALGLGGAVSAAVAFQPPPEPIAAQDAADEDAIDIATIVWANVPEDETLLELAAAKTKEVVAARADKPAPPPDLATDTALIVNEIMPAMQRRVNGVNVIDLDVRCAPPNSELRAEMEGALGVSELGKLTLRSELCSALANFWRKRHRERTMTGLGTQSVAVAYHELNHHLARHRSGWAPSYPNPLMEGLVHELAVHDALSWIREVSSNKLPDDWRDQVGLAMVDVDDDFEYANLLTEPEAGDSYSGVLATTVLSMAGAHADGECEDGHPRYSAYIGQVLAQVDEEDLSDYFVDLIDDRHDCEKPKLLRRALEGPNASREKLLWAFREGCAGEEPEFTLYSMEDCPFCDMAVEYLNDQGIEFEYVDIHEENVDLDTLILPHGEAEGAVPVLAVNGAPMVVGYNPPEFRKLVRRPPPPVYAEWITFKAASDEVADELGRVELGRHEDGTHRDRGRAKKIRSAELDVAYYYRVPMDSHLAVDFGQRGLVLDEIDCDEDEKACVVYVGQAT